MDLSIACRPPCCVDHGKSGRPAHLLSALGPLADAVPGRAMSGQGRAFRIEQRRELGAGPHQSQIAGEARAVLHFEQLAMEIGQWWDLELLAK